MPSSLFSFCYFVQQNFIAWKFNISTLIMIIDKGPDHRFNRDGGTFWLSIFFQNKRNVVRIPWTYFMFLF